MLVKGAKRRRTKAELDEAKAVEAMQNQQAEEKLAAYRELKAERDSLAERLRNAEAGAGILSGFIDKGLVVRRDNGQYVVPSVENEQAAELHPLDG